MESLIITNVTLIIIALLIFIYKMKFTCSHKWNKVDEIRVHDDGRESSMPIGTKYIMQCSKCGAIKHYKTY